MNNFKVSSNQVHFNGLAANKGRAMVNNKMLQGIHERAQKIMLPIMPQKDFGDRLLLVKKEISEDLARSELAEAVVYRFN